MRTRKTKSITQIKTPMEVTYPEWVHEPRPFTRHRKNRFTPPVSEKLPEEHANDFFHLQYLYKLSDPEQIKLRMIWDYLKKIYQHMFENEQQFIKHHESNFNVAETQMEMEARQHYLDKARFSKLR